MLLSDRMKRSALGGRAGQQAPHPPGISSALPTAPSDATDVPDEGAHAEPEPRPLALFPLHVQMCP